MAANSKSGLSKKDREDFMREHGWEIARQGKGDHTVWEHQGLKQLARTQEITCPPNLLNNVAQSPWEHTVPDNPAGGTWHRIQKHALWAETAVKEAKGAGQAEAAQRALRGQFRENMQDMLAWQREMKHRYKTGLDMSESRPAPVTSSQLAALQAKVQRQP